MRMRPRRGALGLRGRIVGAVLVTTVATLGVAALALLGPLEQKLGTPRRTTLQSDLQARPRTFVQLDLTYVSDASSGRPREQAGLSRSAGDAPQRAAVLAARASAARVILLGYPNVHGHGAPVASDRHRQRGLRRRRL